jgi:ABC-type multidrug transport system permease subunit
MEGRSVTHRSRHIVRTRLDMTFVAVATVALLVPLNSMFSGLSVMSDRTHGALRELLAAPLLRWLVPLGNVMATLTISAFQVAVLIGAAVLRGASLHASASGIAWFAAATLLLASAIAGVAEVLAFRLRSQEEYIGFTPAIAIVPWFFAGSLFPVSVLPRGLADFAIPALDARARVDASRSGRRADGRTDLDLGSASAGVDGSREFGRRGRIHRGAPEGVDPSVPNGGSAVGLTCPAIFGG